MLPFENLPPRVDPRRQVLLVTTKPLDFLSGGKRTRLQQEVRIWYKFWYRFGRKTRYFWHFPLRLLEFLGEICRGKTALLVANV